MRDRGTDPVSEPQQKQPPLPPALPERRSRRFRSHDDADFSVALKVVTPILGGSFFTGGDAIEHRHLDTIRVPTIRGHLRFWWRALQPTGLDAAELRKKERELWGGMGGGDKDHGKPKTSKVNVRVESIQPVNPEIDDTPPPMEGKGYALFPAREQKQGGQVVARLKPGITFTVRISCPPDRVEEVRKAVQAWILFGGYGSRTRRGLGSLTVTADPPAWLPSSSTAELLLNLFTGQGSTSDTPTLAGAALLVGQPTQNAESAWDQAIGQLQYFRQDRRFAREQGTQRPGQSRWPEPDKIRHLTGRIQGHPPRFGNQPAWPRAQFGLPIVGRFTGGNAEPGPFSIEWQANGESMRADRLASPLIMKALPLADGKFMPCALWLARGYPRGKVVLVMQKQVVPRSDAAFETMHGTGDKILHPALIGHASVREAFLDWLVSECRWQRVGQ